MEQNIYQTHQRNPIGGISITADTVSMKCSDKHYHDFDEIVIILGGSGYHHFNNESYFVSAGDIFVVKDEAIHYFTDTHKLSIYNIGFQAGVMDQFAPLLQQLPGYHTFFLLEPAYRKQNNFSQKLHLNATDLHTLSDMLTNLSAEFEFSRPGSDFIVTSLFMQITGFLCRKHYDFSTEDIYGVGACAKIIEYIEEHYIDTISLEQLSAISGMSKNGIIALFKRLYGTTPIKYINNQRLNKACTMPKYTDTPITQIAYQCGFSDSNYFARVFKEMRGMTPSNYRKW